ncbi:hypothetical protein EON64_14780 [archaeon]|nr:MAG: hypothetical protein EON64_14780 [archaeon]
MSVQGLESIAKPREKALLSSIFGESESDADDSSGEGEDQLLAECPPTDVEPPAAATVRSYTNPKTPEITITFIEARAKGIAHQLWPAAEYLCEYLQERMGTLIDPPPPLVLELGAGLGLSGLYLASLLQAQSPGTTRVLLTDLEEALNALQRHIYMNRLPDVPVAAAALPWGDQDSIRTLLPSTEQGVLVIAADVVYFEHLFAPLAYTLQHLCCEHRATVIIAHLKRWKRDNQFFALLRRRGLQVEVEREEVDFVPHEHTGQPNKQIKRIYKITCGSV